VNIDEIAPDALGEISQGIIHDENARLRFRTPTSRLRLVVGNFPRASYQPDENGQPPAHPQGRTPMISFVGSHAHPFPICLFAAEFGFIVIATSLSQSSRADPLEFDLSRADPPAVMVM
jgi:hypothetical protein